HPTIAIDAARAIVEGHPSGQNFTRLFLNRQVAEAGIPITGFKPDMTFTLSNGTFRVREYRSTSQAFGYLENHISLAQCRLQVYNESTGSNIVMIADPIVQHPAYSPAHLQQFRSGG